MHCAHCSAEMRPEAVVCLSCGVAKGSGNRFCPACGSERDPAAVVCVRCGASLAPQGAPSRVGARSKLAAGLLGIFLGGFGVHRFYLGYTLIGVLQIGVTVVLGVLTCGFGVLAGVVWGFVEGILILAGAIDRDADGLALKD